MPSTHMRAGVPPTWDRPDPPAQKKSNQNRRVSLFLVSSLWSKSTIPSSMEHHQHTWLSIPKWHKEINSKHSLKFYKD